jgi:hypothetical protein
VRGRASHGPLFVLGVQRSVAKNLGLMLVADAHGLSAHAGAEANPIDAVSRMRCRRKMSKKGFAKTRKAARAKVGKLSSNLIKSEWQMRRYARLLERLIDYLEGQNRGSPVNIDQLGRDSAEFIERLWREG